MTGIRSRVGKVEKVLDELDAPANPELGDIWRPPTLEDPNWYCVETEESRSERPGFWELHATVGLLMVAADRFEKPKDREMAESLLAGVLGAEVDCPCGNLESGIRCFVCKGTGRTNEWEASRFRSFHPAGEWNDDLTRI